MPQSTALPLIIEPSVLEQNLSHPNLLIVDLCDFDSYQRGHIPGAVHLEYARIVRHEQPVMGLLPTELQLNAVLSELGIDTNTHIVAYDNEGGGKASRLLWTLDCAGHKHFSLLNGGLRAWSGEGLPLSMEVETPIPSSYSCSSNKQCLITKEELLRRVGDPYMALLDARSPEEFAGKDVRAARGGHIPGAQNLEWTSMMDPQHHLRLRPQAELREMLEELKITPDKTVVVYCQTHHRSALSYIALKALNYPTVKGYPGAWSDWGNDPATPVRKL